MQVRDMGLLGKYCVNNDNEHNKSSAGLCNWLAQWSMLSARHLLKVIVTVIGCSESSP